MARVTHQDIAERVGTSRTAVTEALHGTHRSRVSQQVRQQILAAAREMGYSPRRVTTHNIAYLAPIDHLFLDAESAFLIAVERSLRHLGFRLMLLGSEGQDDESLRERLSAKSVDGVIATRWLDGRLRDIIAPDMPWVLSSIEYGVTDDVDIIIVDMASTCHMMTSYMIEKGHRRICFVTGKLNTAFFDSMLEGGRRAFREAGLPIDGITVLDIAPYSDLPPRLLPLLNSADAPTGIIAGTSGKALMTTYLLRVNGYRIPEDISIMSVYDSEHLSVIPPFVTATDAGVEVATRVAQRIVEKISAGAHDALQLSLPGRLIERDSVGSPPSRN